jgi:hypothetical protein
MVKQSKEIVTIRYAPHELIFAIVSKSLHDQKIHINTQEIVPLEITQTKKFFLQNQTHIGISFTDFLKKNNAWNLPLAISLATGSIHETFIMLSTATPTIEQFPIIRSPHWHWEYRYLFACDDGMHMYFLAGIERARILQFQLLSYLHHLNLALITPERIALWNLYKKVRHTAFRSSQFALDMIRHNNMIEYYFTHDLRTQLIAQNCNDENSYVSIVAAGLYYSYGSLYENN